MPQPLDIVILGLSLRSSWGNGHATTYRALIRALCERGHEVLFLERDVPWYARHEDDRAGLPGRLALYDNLETLNEEFAARVKNADLVIVGSYVPDGIAVGDWALTHARGVTAFYDIDTPVTLARLKRNDCEYLHMRQIPHYNLYLSFTGGPTLAALERTCGAQEAHALYCAVDPALYYPEHCPTEFDLGYMGTYSDDRQPTLERLLMAPARTWPQGRFVVAGAQYPDHLSWPDNVHRIEHLAPDAHRGFYNAQRYTLNVTRSDMIAAGWSPSVRLFEAAACATPIVSDYWPGLEQLFVPDEEIVIARTAHDVLHCLRDMPEDQRLALGEAARRRVLAEHTATHRAQTLERAFECASRRRARARVATLA